MPSCRPTSATRAAASSSRPNIASAPMPLRRQILDRGQRPLVRWPQRPAGARTRTVRVVTERHESDSRLSYLAYHDNLTGELNRHQLTVILEKTLEEAMRSRSSCGFLLVAIDNLGPSTIPTASILPMRSSARSPSASAAGCAARIRSAAIPAPSSASCSPNARRTTWRSPPIACLPVPRRDGADRRRSRRRHRDNRRGDGAASRAQRAGGPRATSRKPPLTPRGMPASRK